MAIRVIRNPKESPDRLVSRFNKKVQASRIILQVKGRRYFKRKPNKRYLRQAAVMRTHYRAQREKLQYY